MATLKSVLEKDLSKKTKSELIDLLAGMETALTPSVYEKISGIAPSEMSDLTKKEILDIITSFKSSYNPTWEKSFSSASEAVVNMVMKYAGAEDLLFKAADAASANFAPELGSIDFAKIIGGPLDACVRAQSNASVSTVSFINNVGFEVNADGTKKLRMAEFKYKKNAPNPDFDSTKPESAANPKMKIQDVEIIVPFIAMLNIPSFRIETCEIDFNVKLNSTFTSKTDSEFGIKTSASGGTGAFASLFSKVNFSVDVSAKRTSSTGIKVEKEYSLAVRVKATNDEMPAGLEKILGLLSA